jgi:hypothetical protein
MKRVAKNLAAGVLVLFFASGILCASTAAPGLAIASIVGCSEAEHATEMAGCDHSTYLCEVASSNLLLGGAFASAHSTDFSKSAHDLSIGDVPFDAIKETVAIGKYSGDKFLVHRPHKVSTRLLNSILNL